MKGKLSVRRRKQLKSKLESGTWIFFNGGVKTRKTAENTLKEPAAPTLGQGVCENSKIPVEKGKIGESSAKVCSAIANSGKHYSNRNKRRKSGGKKLPTFP